MARENWCMCFSLEEIDKYLKEMKLKTSGARFQKLDRASRWLLGDYSAEDFIATDAEVDEHTAWVDRANLHQTFIDRVCNGQIETPWVQCSDEKEPHPLEYVRDDDVVKCKLEQTRLDMETRVVEKSSLEHFNSEDDEKETSTGETKTNKNADSSPQTVQQHTIEQEASNQAIPAELCALLTQLTQRVTQLAESQSILQTAMENLTQNAHYAPAWSIRLEPTQSGHRQVAFQDTFTFRYPEQQNRNLHIPPRQQLNHPPQTPHNRLVGGAWELGGGGPPE